MALEMVAHPLATLLAAGLIFDGREATLAADLITAWMPLWEGWKLHRELGITL